MTGPYPKLYQPIELDDATATAVHVLRQYALCKREDYSDVMRILNWLEDHHPDLEPACDEMRISFTVPPWDRELRKLIGIKAFNMIIAELNSPPLPHVQSSSATRITVAA